MLMVYRANANRKPRAMGRATLSSSLKWAALMTMIAAAIWFSSSLDILSARWTGWLLARTISPHSDKTERLIIELSATQQELERLRSLEGLQMMNAENRYDILPVRMIGRAPIAWSNLLLLDSGADRNLEIGMPVITPGGMLAGIVASVDRTRASFIPLTHPEIRVAATILDGKKTSGLAQGNANLSVVLRLIPRSERLKEGDIVISSGLQQLIPRGIAIGVIGTIRMAPNDIFQEADVVEFAQAERFPYLGIIRSATTTGD